MIVPGEMRPWPFVLLLALFFAPAVAAADSAADPINAVIGDASWRGDPSQGTEVERIRAHLAYVEGLLREAPAGLSGAPLARRHEALDALARYREAGVFPRRGADPYPGRRPRFIDDRGVHCAVGEMVRATGHAELARQVNARFEYAYIEAIEDPGLARWAKRHGFTLKELAMIQPGYSPVPDDAMIEGLVRDAAEGITLRCAREHEPAKSFRLRVRYVPHRGTRFRSMRWFDDFVQCFLEHAREGLGIGGGAYDSEPHRVRTWMRVQVEPPQAILERRLGALHLGSDASGCFPRPGAVPERVRVRVRVDDAGLHTDVTTRPSNPAIDACLAGQVRQRLGDAFGPGRWRLEAERTLRVEPRVTDERLQRALESYVPPIATECWNEGEPARVDVSVRAHRDGELAIEVGGGPNEAFAACLEPALRQRLRTALGTHVQRPDGTSAPYFRLDADASARLSTDIETPSEREARIQRQREAMERDLQRVHL